MIKFLNNINLDHTFEKIIQNLIVSYQANVDNNIEKYNETIVTSTSEKEINSVHRKLGLPDLKQDVRLVYEIPYNKSVKLDGIKDNDLVKKTTLPTGFIHHADFSKTDKYLFRYVQLVCYNKPLKIPVLIEDFNVWMSPTLMEYNTMKESINKATGNILTFGLGIGFYQYMALLNDTVKSVTIIEIDDRIIQIFKENILPQFNTDKEINIIKGNAFDYFNDEFLSKFDYTFVDIWKSNLDGFDIYKDLVKMSNNLDNVDFWIEEAMLYDIKTTVAMYLFNVYKGTLTRWLNFSKDFISYKKAVHKFFRSIDNTIISEDDIFKYIHDIKILRNIVKLL